MHIIFSATAESKGKHSTAIPILHPDSPSAKKVVPAHFPPSWSPVTIFPFLWLQTPSASCQTPLRPLFLSAAYGWGGSEVSWLSETEGISLRNLAAERFAH
ncbi:hypothetical protein SLEP1_g2581 [Rubroshorea leprosula]|uniref:Uncharacterized protein n=1 Tax=Rubroshorea leprosula TaxID=152421 RepID=A0AAV5HHL8_9ROSI|nr:hypothetical protein SLEP1_g2581 [Rubroshorea leprosula]